MPWISFCSNCSMTPVRRQAPIARRSWSASPGVKPAATTTSFIACSWNKRHAEGLAQDVAHGFTGVFHRLLAVASPQVRVDHVPLDRTRADDRHLDDQVVELLRLQPRQHAHLCAGFDLEDADRVGPLNHLVNRGVFGGNGGQGRAIGRCVP